MKIEIETKFDIGENIIEVDGKSSNIYKITSIEARIYKDDLIIVYCTKDLSNHCAKHPTYFFEREVQKVTE